MLTCPNCRSPLKQVAKTWRCANRHSFDVAKGGYVNLLLPNRKKTASPGDSKLMINARDAFLATGAYTFLLAGIEAVLDLQNLPPTAAKERATLLDMGCGSGYYTRSLFKKENFNRIGIDISKAAVAKAATQDKRSTYAVASVVGLPIQQKSVDLVLNIFSPIDLKELRRVLKPGGYCIKVIPTGNHMKEVAELVYDTFIPHTSSIKADMEAMEKLDIVKSQVIKRTVPLAKKDLQQLITMTPYFYKFSEERLAALQDMKVTLSFEIVVAAKTRV